MTDELHLDLDGQNVLPATLDAHASLALAMALVEAMLAIGEYEEATDEPPFFLTLTEMRGESVHFAFKPVPNAEYGKRGLQAFRQAAKRLPVYLRSHESVPKRLSKPLERLRQATRSLPGHVVARAQLGGETLVLSEIVRSPEKPLITSAETLRAFILRAGGRKPRVQLRMKDQKGTFTADISRSLVEANDFHIYREADVTGVFDRDPAAIGSPIVSGQITDIRLVSPLDRVAAFDRWYATAGSPWKGVSDIEDELRQRGRE